MTQSRIVVVGAGLAGLACAFDLARAGRDVVVFERSPRLGGAVGTLHRSGFMFEIGPNTVPASSDAFRRLAGDLGLAGRLIRTRSESATRWLWFRGRLVELPRSPLGLLTTPLLSVRSRLFLASEPLRRFVPPSADVEPTFEAFLAERIGMEATRLIAGAFVRGVYAAEIDELGARSAFPRLWEATLSHGGLVRGLFAGRNTRGEDGQRISRSALVSFPTGMQEMVDALERALGRRAHVGIGVERITRRGAGWTVATSDGAVTFADRVVIATQAPAARDLLTNVVDTRALAAIRHAEITVVHLGFERDVVLPRGFGYLVPPDESARGSIAPRALGTIFTSNVFAGRTPAGAASVASFYRAHGSAFEGRMLDDRALVDLACDDLRLAIGATARPRATLHHIQRWSDVIPRLEPGHERRMGALLETLREHEPTLHLAGSYVGGVSVDSVITTGRSVAREVELRERANA